MPERCTMAVTPNRAARLRPFTAFMAANQPAWELARSTSLGRDEINGYFLFCGSKDKGQDECIHFFSSSLKDKARC